jgi:two-component system phosphate regulon sensor histidine kinase PhoR
MNKTKVILIAVLMCCALIGVIAMQVKWILHDYHLKDQQFNQRVNEALYSVADKIEKREAYNIISNSFMSFNNDSIFSLLREKKLLDEQWKNETMDMHTEHVPKTIKKVRSTEPPLPPDFPDPLEIDHHDEIKMEISHRGGRKITIRHNRQIITIDDSSTNAEFTENDYQTSIQTDLLERQREKITAKINNWNKMMQTLAFEFITDEKDIEKRINLKQLDTIINNELSSRGISLNYQFGVINVNAKNNLTTQPSSNKTALLNSKYKTDLFPNDLLAKPVLLSLYFPESLSYVLSTMWIMLISSTLFILIIIFGFAYTMHVVFRQKKLSDIKNDFINNMTHEFKTPIATISLATDAVNNPRIASDPKTVTRYMRIIKEENQRMNKQVESILQMALLDKRNFDIKRDELDIHELIKKAAEQIQLQVDVREGTLTMELNAMQHIVVGDASLLFNSILNLLDNANKYSLVKPHITIRTQDETDFISILISDIGIGMSKEIQKNIFEKFYRATSGNLHDVKGFGLGLSFVKAIAMAHKGDVRVVKSEKDKGTTMEFILPLNQKTFK